MNKKHVTFTALLVFMGILTLFSFKKEDLFFLNLEEKIINGDSKIYLKDLTDFSWDTVCMLQDYYVESPYEELSRNGITAIDSKEHKRIIDRITQQSDIVIFVFSKGGKTTEVIYHPSEDILIKKKIYEISYKSMCVNSEKAIFSIEQKKYKNGFDVKNIKILTLLSGE